MRRMFVRPGNCVFILAVLICQVAIAQGQRKSATVESPSAPSAKTAKKGNATTTVVDVVLLRTEDGGALYSQQWLKVFQDIDIKFDIRRPLPGEKADLKERESGYTRFVTAVGTLDRTGQISFPDRTFTPADGPKLKEWIVELKTYGVLGTPTGKPMWGLTKMQFNSIYDGLIKPVDFETEGLALSQILSRLTLPDDLPLHWGVDAKELLAKRGDRAKLKTELKGFSTGTALAIALHENGFGFRPNRTPNGSVELLIEPRDTKYEIWPIGWPMQKRPLAAAPKMFSLRAIELSDQSLADVITAAEKLTEIPILVDYAELDARQIDLEKIEVSFPLKKSNWNIALDRMVKPHRLTQELWEDEAGRMFVWLTTSKVGRPAPREKP